MKVKFTIIYFVLILFLIGCSNEDQPKDTSQQPDEDQAERQDETENEEPEKYEDQEDEKEVYQSPIDNTIPEVPEDTAGFIQQVAGSYSGVNVYKDNIVDQVKSDINKLSPLPKDATDEQLDD
ncbi:hypothetical protein [Lentibacillus saliphilus]|uniref:hypothetical protein n=1 Tax=Lentibacillus saliphilus TaxID=2737028 RepID=UPI001C2F736C|nr:hypothetical protein [Lentibacillus saliphilus]